MDLIITHGVCYMIGCDFGFNFECAVIYMLTGVGGNRIIDNKDLKSLEEEARRKS